MKKIALILTILTVSFPFPALAHDESFDQVMKSRTLRCAYTSLSPFLEVDLETNEVKGIFREVLDDIGDRLNLKVDWTEDVNYPQIAAGFTSKRYDAFCGVLWATPARGGGMKFSDPIYYQSVSPCVAGSSTEYDESTEPLNNSDKKLIGYDGDVSAQIAKTVFPKAEFVAISDNIPFSEAMQWIAAGKVDGVATCDRIVVKDVNEKRPGSLKLAAPDKPITHVQVSVALPLGSTSLTDMINLAIFDMQADGTLEKIMTKYLGEKHMKTTVNIPKVGQQ